MKITAALAAKVLKVVDAGLVNGLGEPTPGKMCVEAAVCYALDLPHSDHPTCVGEAVRAFKIRLNDARWSSDKARTNGMRKLAIAQLGSNEIDQAVFVKELTLGTIKKIVPLALRCAANKQKEKKHKVALEAAAVRCEEEGTREAAAAAYAAAYAAYATTAAAAAAYAAAYAASAAAKAASTADNATTSDESLLLMADIGLEALKKAKSPGCEFLYLAEAA